MRFVSSLSPASSTAILPERPVVVAAHQEDQPPDHVGLPARVVQLQGAGRGCQPLVERPLRGVAESVGHLEVVGESKKHVGVR